MAEKVTTMKLKVDLQCNKCYKRVKKVLCKFPQIRNQEYDQKNNIVTITVVCCSPEKIRDKLCCKGRGAIKSIEIVEPPKPKEKPPSSPKSEKPKEKNPPPTEQEKPPPPPAILIGICCGPCCEGRPGGPCFLGYGRPLPPCYGYRRPCYGYGRPCYVSSCGECLCEDNTSACTIM